MQRQRTRSTEPGGDSARPGERRATGARILCEALIREGVDVLFGIPGGAIMPFYHVLAEYRDRLRHVLCRHEQGAGHAAEGYARASGRVGVCVATSGPGATNLVTPLANAYMDGTPIVAITGQVVSPLLGTDAFQETDILGMTMPITKHAFQVTRAEEIVPAVREAFRIATSGRPGPVLIDITKDAQQATAPVVWPDAEERAAGDVAYRTPLAPQAAELEAAARLLLTAERPLILAGYGVIQASASAELLRLAELLRVPVATTLQGKGGFPDDHPLALGMPGMHGWVHVNRAMQASDLVFNVGSRFDDRVTGRAAGFAPGAKIVHVDIDPSQIGKVVRADVGIVADAREALVALLEAVEASGGLSPEIRERREAWREEIEAMRRRHGRGRMYRERPRTSPLMPHDVYAAFNATARRRTGSYRVVTDVGQHQMWAAQLLEWRHPRTHLTSGGAGTMGFSIPAALGAAIACPDETIWVICGDGGFQMTCQELATLTQEGIRNVKIAVINNGYLGMVRQWQQLFEGRRYSGTPLSGPDLDLLARAYGARPIRLDHAAAAESAFEEAWDHDGLVVMDCRVEQEANVFPIVPQGGALDDMWTDAPATQEESHEAGVVTAATTGPEGPVRPRARGAVAVI